jgi:hypothetical protein
VINPESAPYSHIISGIHLNTPESDYTLVQLSDDSSVSVFQNRAAVPNPGNFDSESLWEETETVAGVFSDAPAGHTVYCNGLHSCIYGGSNIRCAAFIRTDQPVTGNYNDNIPRNPMDVSERIQNTDPAQYITLISAKSYLVGSTRPLSGMTFKKTGSSTLDLNDLTFSVYTGISGPWEILTVSVSGEIAAWDPDILSPAPLYLEGRVLYWYQIQTAGSGLYDEFYHLTLSAPFQTIKDLWDGVYRQPILCQVVYDEDKHEDYTVEVNEPSTADYPAGAEIRGDDFQGHLIIMFEEPVAGMRFNMIPQRENKNAGPMIAEIWAGDWIDAELGTSPDLYDTTRTGTTFSGPTLGRTGDIIWKPSGIDAPVELYGVRGYAYRLSGLGTLTNVRSVYPDGAEFVSPNGIEFDFGAGLSLWDQGVREGDVIRISGTESNNGEFTITSMGGVSYEDIKVQEYITGESAGTSAHLKATTVGDLVIDTIGGIAAPKTVKPFKFPVFFKDRLFLCNYEQGNERNRADYCAPFAPEVWNGKMTSDGGVQSLYFGNHDALTCGAQIYNRFGSSIYTFCLFFKKSETYILNGNGPEDYQIFPVSFNVGCPAPKTLIVAELGYEMADGVNRSVAIWLAYRSVYIMDGAILTPIQGADRFFGPDDPERIDTNYIDRAAAGYDAKNREYNLVYPSIRSVHHACDVWLVYDLIDKKWYRKDTGDAPCPQMFFSAEDTDGIIYLYAGLNNGRMVRIDHGKTWEYAPGQSENIYQLCETGDFYPASLWHVSRIRRMMLMAAALSETAEITITHFSDTDRVETVCDPVIRTLQLFLGNTQRLTKVFEPVNLYGWAHRIQFRCNNPDVKLLAWAFEAHAERLLRQ